MEKKKRCEWVQELIRSRTVTETLVIESSETAEHVPRLINSIRESQKADTPAEKFRAQSRLIRDSQQVASNPSK